MSDLELKKTEQSAKPETAPSKTGEHLPELRIKAVNVVNQLMAIGPREVEEQREMVTEVETLGKDVEHRLSETSALLKKPIHELAQAAEDGSEVDQALLALQGKVRDVNPSDLDFSMSFLQRMLAKLPFVGTPLSRWAAKYQEVSAVIQDIANGLRLGMQQLAEDNNELAKDRDRMRKLTFELEDYVAFGELLDAEVVKQVEQEQDADKKKFMEEEILFALRQRIMDLQQRLAVNQQGVQSADLLISNNKELIRGIKRALDVTIEALSVASTIAMGLARQKKQLEALQATNDTASELLLKTSERLRSQGVEIHKNAASASMDMAKLKETFANSLAAWEDINSFRREALPTMRQTINELQALSDQQRDLTEQMEQGQAARNRFANTFSLDSVEN